jgi:uncharacterized protein YijF (DUF1287 family)
LAKQRREDESLPKKAASYPQKEIAATTKHRGVGEVEVVVEERRGGQTKTVSIYKHISISSWVVAVGRGVVGVVGEERRGEERRGGGVVEVVVGEES